MPRSRRGPDLMPALLQVEGLGFSYGAEPLFDPMDFAFGPGVALVVGGDGRGKSTLMAILAGVLPAQHGDCMTLGVRLSTDPVGYRANVRRAEEDADALEACTVREWLARRADGAPDFDVALQDALVEGLQLTPHLEKTGVMLSTGTRRKALIAAALAAGAPVTLLDDPFAALDFRSVGVLTQALARLGERHDRLLLLACHAPVEALDGAPVLDLGD
jgi:ABC-type multidrug transport system ATPase subunit